MRRQPALDALRGIFLVMMTLTHLPVPLGRAVGQPLGFVSAAEGFVLLSAFLLGLIYGARLAQDGYRSVARALRRRALKLYLCQLGLLMLAFTCIAPAGRELGIAAISNLFGYQGAHPLLAAVGGALLVHAPPLLDILPMYAVFVALSPVVLRHAQTRGWRGLLCASAALWLLAQLGLKTFLHKWFVTTTGLPFPFSATGSFDIFGWQLLWMLGLYLGSRRARGVRDTLPADSVVWRLCLVLTLYFFAWRHTVGIFPFGHDGSALNVLADKWTLGPLRLANFLVLTALLWRWGPMLAPFFTRGPLVQLGRQALPVFCTQTVLSLIALALIGDEQEQLSWRAQAVIVSFCLVVLYGVARAAELLSERRRMRTAVPAA
ncbi:OpgC domain-containing protein [Niveibacterium sp. SC-1]|uniref:OpgC family protein n=1 Tax=Niveibacterium sp. SC-1 TaxID=3135646 RepID=UPI00312049AB